MFSRVNHDNAALNRFLHRDELRHITPLKMRSLYGEQMRGLEVTVADETAYVMVMPRAVSQYDSVKYPTAMHVVCPALSEDASLALIDAVVDAMLDATRGESFVVKTIDVALIAALRDALGSVREMRYERALCTFVPSFGEVNASRFAVTRRAVRALRLVDGVEVFPHVSDVAIPLLDAHDVYSASELAAMFAGGDGRCWVRRAEVANTCDGDAVAVLLTFPNTPTLHEIGSLYVRPDARRAGYAQVLVRAALDDLLGRSLSVRYVVDAQNAASIALAERCGLREAMRLEHWLVNAI